MKHTKGEWQIEYDNDDKGQWYNAGPAQINYGWHCSNLEEQEVIDNAKLIAAAPDLLETVTRFIKYYEKYAHNVTPLPERIISPIRVAIKKATE